jgi:hypothetical protein
VDDKADSVALHRVLEPTLSVTVPVGLSGGLGLVPPAGWSSPSTVTVYFTDPPAEAEEAEGESVAKDCAPLVGELGGVREAEPAEPP